MRILRYLQLVFCALSTVFWGGCVFAQTTNDNYIKVYKASKGITGDLSTVNDKNLVTESIEYYDGLGRPLQSVAKQGSRLGYDIVTFSIYDSYGRKTTNYLPYVANSVDGAVKASPLASQTLFYQNQFGVGLDHKAYSIQLLENSELNRILKAGAPGIPWQPNTDPYSLVDNSVKKRTEFNGSNEVYLFTYDPATGQAILNPTPSLQYYSPNQLYANKSYDEHNNEVIEYTDKEGRTVCKKVYLKTENNVRKYANTHYIYDDLDNLVVVLPPEALKAINPQY